MVLKIAAWPAVIAGRPRKCSPRILTKSASSANGAPNAGPSMAFQAASSWLTMVSIELRSSGARSMDMYSPLLSSGVDAANERLVWKVDQRPREAIAFDVEAPAAMITGILELRAPFI